MTHTEAAAVRQTTWGTLLGLLAAGLALVPGWQGKLTLACLLFAAPLTLWLINTPNRWITVFVTVAWLLPPLPIHLGDSGPHVAVVVALTGLIAGLLRLSKWRFQPDRLTLLLLAFSAVLLVSCGTAAIYSGTTIAAASFARVMLFGIAVYTFLYIRYGPFQADPTRLNSLTRTLFYASLLSAVIACLDFYFQFSAPAGFGAQFIWLDSGMFRRAQGVFYEASTLGNLCVFVLDMIAVAIVMPREAREICPLPRWVLAAGGVVLAAAMVLSYSRASLANLSVGLAVLIWLRRRSVRIGRYLAYAAGVGVACYALLVMFVPLFTETYWTRLYTSFEYFGVAPDAILSGRLRSWDALTAFLITHPWHAVVGIGYKTLAYSDFTGAPIIADNAYLSSLVETGLLGLGLLVALNITVIRCAHRASRSTNPRRRFYGTWLLCFWAGEIVQMFSGDVLTYWRVLPAYFCIMALAIRVDSHGSLSQ